MSEKEGSGMTPGGMVMETPGHTTEEQTSSSNSFLTAGDSTPTNTTSVKGTISISESAKLTKQEILKKYTSSDTDVLDVVSNSSRKRRKQTKIVIKKDKCPCSTSDKTSWKLVCCKCRQTWHTACCNLNGITSIVELEDWECPWCYIPLYKDPAQATKMTSTALIKSLEDIQSGVNSVQDNVNQLCASDLKTQIGNLQNSVSQLTASKTSHDDINKVHDDILNSINFELHQIVSKQESVIASEISEMKKTLENVMKSSDQRESPNTPSSTEFPGKPYDLSQQNFLDENSKSSLHEFLAANATNFESSNGRHLLYFGEYGYKYSSTGHKPSPIPDEIQQIINKIQEHRPNSTKLNSCLITRYDNGKSICPSHGDDEAFIAPTSDIFTLSIGVTRVMQFDNCQSRATIKVPLCDNSLLSFSRASQDFWHHSIVADDQISTVRFSLTFRSLSPHNLNYTVLIGDSNTADIRFGTEKGTLGKWVPGVRHKASKIKFIPGPHEIGPCRNIVLNVGVNDVREPERKSTEYLVSQYEAKLKSIMSVYPKTKIYISLLLPTKDEWLNFGVNELNKSLKNLASNFGNVFVIEHDSLVDRYGFLNPILGRFRRGRPNPDDHVHLGAEGIKRFVLNIKNKIMYRKLFGLTRGKAEPLPSSSARGPWASSQPPYPTSTTPWYGGVPPSRGPPLPHPALSPGPESFNGSHLFGSIGHYESQFPGLTSDGYQG